MREVGLQGGDGLRAEARPCAPSCPCRRAAPGRARGLGRRGRGHGLRGARAGGVGQLEESRGSARGRRVARRRARRAAPRAPSTRARAGSLALAAALAQARPRGARRILPWRRRCLKKERADRELAAGSGALWRGRARPASPARRAALRAVQRRRGARCLAPRSAAQAAGRALVEELEALLAAPTPRNPTARATARSSS